MKRLLEWLFVLSIITFFASCGHPSQSVLNDHASVHASDSLPENPLLLNPLTSTINVNDSTMSTLYGNDLARMHARTEGNNLYSEGSVLYEVTWKERPDSVWFGANIPKEIISVERIVFNKQEAPGYKIYTGHPLRKSISQNELQRIKFISSQRMAVSP